MPGMLDVYTDCMGINIGNYEAFVATMRETYGTLILASCATMVYVLVSFYYRAQQQEE